MQHSKVMFSLFLFLTRKAILRKFGPNQNFQFKLKFVTKDNSNMQNSMIVFTFSLKYQANLVRKIKLVSFSWNLIPRLIRIWRIQWWYSLFFCFERKYPFSANLVPKFKIDWLKQKFGTQTMFRILHISNM